MHHVHFQSFSSVPSATHSSVPLSRPCLTPYVLVSCLYTLSSVLCPLSFLSVPCLPSYVSFYSSLFFVSRPLSPVLPLCSLSSVLCPLYHLSVPCLLSSIPCLTSLFLGSGSLYPVSCDLSPVSVSPSLSYEYAGPYCATPHP